ncbi:MAG: glycosyltransferase family 39 protein [Bacteroidia bacterium]
MSKNFANESMDIFHPRVDRRRNTNGITGSHFPLYEWGLAATSKLIPFSDTLARSYSAVIFSFVMLAFYLLLRVILFDRFQSAAGSLLLLSIPQFYYDSINAMPDNLALALALFGLYFIIQFYRNPNWLVLLAAYVVTLFAGLIKFQFLIIPFAAIAFIKINRLQVIGALILSTIVVPVYLWYQYALELMKLNNIKEFGLWIKPISPDSKWQTFIDNLMSDAPELLMGWPSMLALIVLGFRFIPRFKLGKRGLMIMLWLMGFAIFYIVAIERMKHHSYYFMALLPLFGCYSL